MSQTAEQTALVAQRRMWIRDWTRVIFRSEGFAVMTSSDNIRDRGSIVKRFIMSVPKLALLGQPYQEDGQTLLDHWPGIEELMRVGWRVFHASMSVGAWGQIANRMDSAAFGVDRAGAPEGFVYHGTGWTPVQLSGSSGQGWPGFGIISDEDVYRFLGWSGGVEEPLS